MSATETSGPSPKVNMRLTTPELRAAWEDVLAKVRRINDQRPTGPVVSASTFLQAEIMRLAAESDEATVKRLGLGR